MLKVSSPATHDFWEIAVLFEDCHLLVLDKPRGLLTSPDRIDPHRPSLMKLLHAGIERGAPWASERGLHYLMNAHRLEPEASGVLLLAKSKKMLASLANLFGSSEVDLTCLGVMHGVPKQRTMTVDARLALLPSGMLGVDQKRGKKSRTRIQIREQFNGYTLIEAHPQPGRPRQVQAHLRHARLPLAGDESGGAGPLLLSRLKSSYRLKPKKIERPLLGEPIVHLEEISFTHPITSVPIKVAAPWPRDLTVAVKYLRRYAAADALPPEPAG